MEDKISVIIPMYNAANYIIKLLDCLKKQTYKKLQIIIINDGSTDESLKLAKEFASSNDSLNIKIISQKNSGVSKARNVGLKHATGKYITFLDADDYIEYDTYEKIIKKMKEENVDVIRVNYIKENINSEVLNKGNMFDLSNRKISKDEIKEKVIPYIFENKIEAYTPLLFINSSAIKKVNLFNEDIHMMEDLLFYLDLLLNIENIYFYDYYSYHYLFNLSSSSKNRANLMRNFNDVIKIVALIEKFLRLNNFDKKIYNQVYYIYSTMLVKYTLRTFQKDDEFKLTFREMIKLLDNDSVMKIIDKADFNLASEYIKKAGMLMQNRNFKELFEFAESIKQISI